MSSSVYAGRTDQDRSSKRRRNDTEPEIKVMRITCPPRPAFDEWTPFLEEVARTEGLQELLEFNKTLPEAMLSQESHTRDKCKYLNEKPPEKGGPNKCAICYGEHWLTRCLYQNSVPQGLQVGPCYIILCKRCGKDIDNTLFCPCCKGTVPGRVGRRVCDCCGEDMLSGCRCHFLSSDSGDSVLPSNSGDSAVRPSIDRRRFKGNSGRGNRPQNFQSRVQAFTPSYAQYSYPNYSRPDFELDFWHGRLPDHFGCPACMTPLHGPTQCPLRFLYAGTQLLDSGHPFWYPDPACGKDIDNTLFCPCCKGTVPGRVGRRVCDCCGEDMLSGCRCHFLSSNSGDSVLLSNSGDSAVRPSIDRRGGRPHRFKGNSGRGNRPQNFQSRGQAFTPTYFQYSCPNYWSDFQQDFWNGRAPDHFGCPACMTPLHGPTQCPLRFLFAGTRTQLLDSGHPFWYPDPAGVYVGRTEE